MSVAAPPRRPRAAPARTPGVRQGWRRVRFWVGFALIAAAFAVIALMIRGAATTASGVPLGADDPAPQGARAVVRVLEEHGVTVRTADSLASARRAAAGHPETTVLVYDPARNLPAARADALLGVGARTVLVQPSSDLLAAITDDIRPAGAAAKHTRLPADCADPAARRAGSITASGRAYRVSPPALGCFPAGGATVAVASLTRAGHRIDVLGSTRLLDNEHIVADGNAAFALGTLGAHPRLVWYLPSTLDRPGGTKPSLAELTPGWVSPVVALLMAAAGAAVVWRGRRMGPLVVEDLPVTVHSRETMEGRARLYQRADARLRAIDSLRIGATGRLASRLGLGPHLPVSEVADAAAELVGRPTAEVRGILVDGIPESDTELMRLSDALARLEHEVEARSRARTADGDEHEKGRHGGGRGRGE